MQQLFCNSEFSTLHYIVIYYEWSSLCIFVNVFEIFMFISMFGAIKHCCVFRMNVSMYAAINVYCMWAKLSENMFVICEQQRGRSTCASAQSDQCLCSSLPWLYNNYSCFIRNFRTLASELSRLVWVLSWLHSSWGPIILRTWLMCKSKLSILF